MTRRRLRRPRMWVLLLCIGLAATAGAGEGRKVQHGPVDYAVVHVDRIARDTPVRIRDFSVERAHLGNPKHRDVSEKVAAAAPHLLSADLLEALRARGFTDVAPAGEGDSEGPVLVIEGRFTMLDPGSQAARIMLGFGAGKSRVCVSGDVVDASGTVLATFEHCRKGTGWGDSGGELTKEASSLGEDIAAFLDAWASGRYAD